MFQPNIMLATMMAALLNNLIRLPLFSTTLLAYLPSSWMSCTWIPGCTKLMGVVTRPADGAEVGIHSFLVDDVATATFVGKVSILGQGGAQHLSSLCWWPFWSTKLDWGCCCCEFASTYGAWRAQVVLRHLIATPQGPSRGLNLLAPRSGCSQK